MVQETIIVKSSTSCRKHVNDREFWLFLLLRVYHWKDKKMYKLKTLKWHKDFFKGKSTNCCIELCNSFSQFAIEFLENAHTNCVSLWKDLLIWENKYHISLAICFSFLTCIIIVSRHGFRNNEITSFLYVCIKCNW